jgi:hypothetical protein
MEVDADEKCGESQPESREQFDRRTTDRRRRFGLTRTITGALANCLTLGNENACLLKFSRTAIITLERRGEPCERRPERRQECQHAQYRS